MPHYMVTTRLGEPIEATSAEHAKTIAEDQDYGLVEVSEVIRKDGTWRRVGELHNLGGMRRTIPVRLTKDDATYLRDRLSVTLRKGELDLNVHPMDLDGVLDGNPVTVRIIVS